MARFVTVSSQKGGVAKTTTCVNLAAGLALRGSEILLIDTDGQGQCATALGMRQESGLFELLVSRRALRECVRLTGRERLYLLPGDKRSATAELVLSAERAPIDTLLERIREGFNGGGKPDFVILDTAPSISGLGEMALWAADEVLIPTACDGLSTEGVAAVIATIERLAERGWPGRIVGILPTFYDQVTRESQTVLADLRSELGDLVLEPIHRATKLREAAAYGKTVYEYAPRSRAAEEYEVLVASIEGEL